MQLYGGRDAYVKQFLCFVYVYRGQFGVVIQCIDKSTRQRVAIKIISKENACKERDSTIRELEALQRARGHSRLVQLIDVFHTSTETAFVLEK